MVTSTPAALDLNRRSESHSPTNKARTAWRSGLLLWSGKRDSNPRPSAWEADALPTELFPHRLRSEQAGGIIRARGQVKCGEKGGRALEKGRACALVPC